MKNVLLGTDGEIGVYSVPDDIADNLVEHCMRFCNEWLYESPDAAEYRGSAPDGDICLCYDESDFIDYLNKYVCREEKCELTELLKGVYEMRKVPPKYRKFPRFFF